GSGLPIYKEHEGFWRKHELAKANRDYLRGLYGIIKGSARHVRFVFVTGITMFSKVSLFSGLNNLEDISLDPQYATLCGYTERELETVFALELLGIDRDEIRTRYYGYRWQGEETVYNPFDVLLLLKKRVFRSWWFETGSPDFLYRLIVERGMNPIELEHRPIDAERLANFDVGDIDLMALMFQAGYLTIGGEERAGADTFYALEYPNLEVRRSFSKGFLSHLGQREAATEANALLVLLARLDFRGFGERLQAYLAGLPYQWLGAGKLGEYEAHYAAMLYLAFSAVGSDVRVEDASSRGRADMVLLHGGRVYVLEFKMARDREGVDAAMDRALSQMRERGYGERYRARGEPIHLVGVVFGREERNLLAVEAEHC
ncbi:MAG: AAA family ATPase, partial [Bryobacterales bacterium]|nr:AAA family ATPase [Bryobacterales bacterium]